ncbi:hypothetical protein [Candidatus Nitrospira bockiana]
MLTYGRKHCQLMSSYDTMVGDQYTQYSGTRLGSTYYDGERVYYQILEYTGDPTWKYCSGFAEKFYRDEFVFPLKGEVPGYWNFTHGLLMDYNRTKDEKSKDAALLIAQNAAYSRDYTPLSATASAVYARDTSYAVMGYVNAEKLGAAVRPRKAQLIDQLLDYINQWFITRIVLPGGEPHPDDYLKPPFVGLAMQGLIYAYEQNSDPRILNSLVIALDGLWERAWMPTEEAFYYANNETPLKPAPDLNLLIAPAYAWMYLQTGDTKYRDRGDQIFSGGVKRAWLEGTKQFNQNYWWSFDYVKWRQEANVKYAGQSPTSSDTATATTSTDTTLSKSTDTSTTTNTVTSITPSTSTTTTQTTTSSESTSRGLAKGKLKQIR